MIRARLTTILLGLAGLCWATGAARAEPQHIALVIANGHYATLPPLARCDVSAAAVRDALKAKGFEVVEKADLGRGEFDAAIGALAHRAAASPAVAVLYYCGYGLEFNGRSFLLPVTANLARDNDVLTQGVLSKSLVDSLARAGEASGVVLLDAFPPPGGAGTGMARLVEQIMPGRFAVVGASNDAVGEAPTPASQAVRAQFTGDEISLEAFVTGLRRQLPPATAVIAATGQPSFLAGGPPEPPAPSSQSPSSPQPPPVAAPPAPPPTAPPAASQRTIVDEDAMSELERRQIQVALATLGYYSGRIDGVFGPETRAAIRRYQFEIKAEMTGRLNSEQATRLFNGVH